MYSEDDLKPLSALQHLAFCERQWALIHLEQIWADSTLTVEGDFLHKRSDSCDTEVRQDLRIVRGLRLRSLRLGVSGIADVVEFHRIKAGNEGKDNTNDSPEGVRLPDVRGMWKPFPVEYKRGRPKKGACDTIQLCAQAMCLEEMLNTRILSGALFYGQTKRRMDITFDDVLRGKTETLAHRLHMLTEKMVTPTATYGKWCERCSLKHICRPDVTCGKSKTGPYINAMFNMFAEDTET